MPEMKYPILDIFENVVPEPARCPNMLKNTRSMPEKLMPDHSLIPTFQQHYHPEFQNALSITLLVIQTAKTERKLEKYGVQDF